MEPFYLFIYYNKGMAYLNGGRGWHMKKHSLKPRIPISLETDVV